VKTNKICDVESQNETLMISPSF